MRDITTLKETSSKEDFDGNWKGQGSAIWRRSFDLSPFVVVCASHEFSNTRGVSRTRVATNLESFERREGKGVATPRTPSNSPAFYTERASFRVNSSVQVERGKWSGEWERLGRRVTSATDYYSIINLIDWFVGFYTWRRGCRKLESGRLWNLRRRSWFVSG